MAEQETTTQSTKNKGGRPKKINNDVINQAREYFNSFDISVSTLLPTIEGLALKLHINRDTVYQWEKENEMFSDIVNDLRALQAEKLIQNSVVNRYNAMIAKLLLSGKHGYIEKSEQDVTTNGKDIATPVLVKFVGENGTTDTTNN